MKMTKWQLFSLLATKGTAVLSLPQTKDGTVKVVLLSVERESGGQKGRRNNRKCVRYNHRLASD